MRRWYFPLLVSLLVTGCLDMQTTVVLQRDLSGTAAVSVGVDMEPMVYVMATIGKAFEGKSGPPTEQELADARQELLAEQEQEAFDPEKIKADAARELPEGVELGEVTRREEGLKTTYRIQLTFDDVRKLQQVDLSGAAGPPDEYSPEADVQREMNSPFSELTLVDEGSTWMLKSPPMNPVAGSEERMGGFGGMEGMEGMLDRIFRNLKITFVIEVATGVVAHNATRVEGGRLTWVFDYATLKETTAGPDEGMWVRFRK
jgi:hypothetical protein